MDAKVFAPKTLDALPVVLHEALTLHDPVLAPPLSPPIGEEVTRVEGLAEGGHATSVGRLAILQETAVPGGVWPGAGHPAHPVVAAVAAAAAAAALQSEEVVGLRSRRGIGGAVGGGMMKGML